MPFCMASLKFVRACFTTDSSACAPVVPGFHYIIVEWVHEVKSYMLNNPISSGILHRQCSSPVIGTN